MSGAMVEAGRTRPRNHRFHSQTVMVPDCLLVGICRKLRESQE